MKRTILCSLTLLMVSGCAFALDTVFDSMDKATEVKLAPAIKTTSSQTNTAKPVSSGQTSIKTEKFNSALVNLDDAQVELRQELAVVTSKYNAAVEEKDKAVANCKNLKREINAINKKMRNIDKSKKMINKNLESE